MSSTKSTTKTNDSAAQAHLKNDFGADLWVKKGTVDTRHPTAGRGLFAGLQDQKQYNVGDGWAKRNADASTGFLGWVWNKVFGGNYKPPQQS
ncbi:uncharacterized protein BDV14DRAFT_196224 [Aspergillus stella-maris]|uniref:uncharacterized protein n=1 Tax=Aspergillus stella-maris TaxID=1810926 RepID=UPI003CCD8DB1